MMKKKNTIFGAAVSPQLEGFPLQKYTQEKGTYSMREYGSVPFECVCTNNLQVTHSDEYLNGLVKDGVSAQDLQCTYSFPHPHRFISN